MIKRIFTGVIAAGFVIFVLYEQNFWMAFASVLLCCFIGSQEFERLLLKKVTFQKQILIFLPLAITIYLMSERILYGMAAFAGSFVFLCMYYVFRAHQGLKYQAVVTGLSVSAFGLIYLLCGLGFILPILKMGPMGRSFLLWLFLVVFIGDTVAYFVGSWMGKRKLTPNISPKKTVEGAIGALLSSFVVTWAWSYFILHETEFSDFTWKFFYFSPFASVLAQTGDLLESLMKRSQAKKDSGQLLPGHGGILDRIDGLVLVSPIYYIFLSLVLVYES
jgi:phosphatidate cytidylyltransferase